MTTRKHAPGDQEIMPTIYQIDAVELDETLRRARQWPYMMFGVLLVASLIGVLATWSVRAKIEGAVIAGAEFAVESKRKTLQHLEGGIVQDILVREGDRVFAGQVVLRLDSTLDRASFSIIKNDLNERFAQRDRLFAELQELRDVTFSDIGTGKEASLLKIQSGQRNLFAARLSSRDSERDLRIQRIQRLKKEIAGLTRQRQSNDKQIELVDTELKDLSKLAAQALVPKRRLLALEREAERIRGQSEALNVSIARSHSLIDEIKLEGLRAKRQFNEQVTTELRLIEPMITNLLEQIAAARKKLSLVEVRAPSDGFVVDLKAHTVGGVIRPGGEIMDIIPEHEKLILEARVSPVDIDKVRSGQQARIQLTAFDQAKIPEAIGKVISISADSLKDERSGKLYYLARLQLSAQQPQPVQKLSLVPGMPATVFLETGARSPLSYLLEPIASRLPRVFADS